ncbi:MAG: glycosyltransferase family 2 protein [Candidatus Dormibacteraeota bacterium]|nr:glycosyltransferase family 2 protein [Candidatus Dormibacteraeota bacterium]
MHATIRDAIAMAERAPIVFAETSEPLVSVVMPVYNNWRLTRRALASLATSHDAGVLEVIVVDDASTDETRFAEAAIPGLRVIRMTKNSGFTHAANRGAQAARGRHTLFLNNDTLVLAGAIRALIAAMGDASIGAAGALLLYPSGWVQEAGALVRPDGTCNKVGWGCNPAESTFGSRRDRDYCSAAALLVRTSLLATIGWFDVRFAPGYYEDVDLCFSVRARGLRVVVEPAASVVHWEGMTHGTEWRRGIHRQHTKSLQARNRLRFVAKWSTQLADREVVGIAHTEQGYGSALRPA